MDQPEKSGNYAIDADGQEFLDVMAGWLGLLNKAGPFPITFDTKTNTAR